MVSSASEIPTHAKGKIIINATLLAAPGQGDKLQEHLAAIRRYSLSEQEPGCLGYRTVRSFVTEGAVKFHVFETYTGVDALAAHFATALVQKLLNEAKGGTLFSSPPQIEYFYEFE